MQHRSAVWLFTAQLCILLAANIFEVLSGTSLLLTNPEARAPTAIIFALLAAQIAYARWLKKRGQLH